jgi:hypothetical protein
MRYPRAYLVFDKTSDDFSEGFFQNISGLKSKIYLSEHSKRINSIENELLEIKLVDNLFNQSESRYFLVMNNPKLFDFLLAYFSDKKLQIYWVDTPNSIQDASKLLRAIKKVQHMKSILYHGIDYYYEALAVFEKVSDRKLSSKDEWVEQIAFKCPTGYYKTTLEVELSVLLKSKLRFGIANRIDLQCSTFSKSN